jgi:glucose-1-phosphate thymidylyltransferase
MNIIVPMAGMGKRLRPHTLTTPKPLVSVAGKPIVQRLVEDIAARTPLPVEHIAFVTGRFGSEVESKLLDIAKSLGAQGHICYQDTPLGTAHAIMCAEKYLYGNVTVAFADTLFRADFTLDTDKDGILWVKQIDDPTQFGVVKTDENGVITEFVEKPKSFVSDLAMIGIYYFKDGDALRGELQFLLDNDITKGGEYQLPDALTRMTAGGHRFVPGKVDAWLDFGNKPVSVASHAEVLDYLPVQALREGQQQLENALIIEPCFLGDGVNIRNSVVGPHVSLGAGTKVSDAVISNSIVQHSSHIQKAVISGAMIGAHAEVKGRFLNMSISDYSAWEA